MRNVFLSILSIGVFITSANAKGIIPAKSASTNILKFEENKGQWNANVKYKAELNGMNMFLEKNAFTYLLYKISDGHQNASAEESKFHAYQVTFEGALDNPSLTSNYPLNYYRNYFIDNDPSRWASKVHLYESVTYNDLYNGIDMNVYSASGHMKYDFVVNPGANYSQIKLNYKGADKIFVDEKGDLNIYTSLGNLKELKPVVYQVVNGQKKYFNANYTLRSSTLSFNIESGYDKTLPLIIDPTLIASTYTGSTADNWGYTATYDNYGNIYVGGIAFAQGYPTTLGAIDGTFNGGGGVTAFNGSTTSTLTGTGHDAVVTKFNPTGTTPMYSTYFGGSASSDQPHSMVVGPNNHLIIMGRTGSTNFPTTAGAYDNTFNGNFDIFVLSLDSSGASLVGSTFMGGSQDDGVNIGRTLNYLFTDLRYNYGDDSRSEVIVDSLGSIYVAGVTRSSNFPVTGGVLQSALSGTQDGCLFKLDSTLSNLAWSTYYGGTGLDACYSLVLDKDLNVYVTGGTTSTGLATGGAYNNTFGGVVDGFLTHVKNDGTSVLNSTYIGTTAYDQSFFVQLDNEGDVYVTGQTKGAYPVSSGVYSNAGSAHFIHELDSSLSTSKLSTVFGNGTLNPSMSPTAFLVDDCGRIYVSGWGGTMPLFNGFQVGLQADITGMPTTANAYQTTTDGKDFYLIALESNMSGLAYATYLGGNSATEPDHVDGGTARFDKKGIVYQAVCASCGTPTNDFPTLPGAWSQTDNSNNCNAAVFKFDFRLKDVEAKVTASTNNSCAPAPYNVTFSNSSVGAAEYSWDYGDGSPLDTVNFSPVHTYTANGTYTVTLIVADPNSCNKADTSTMVIDIQPAPDVYIGSDTTVCTANNLLLDAGVTGASYLWSNGSTNQAININQGGSYWVRVTENNCVIYDTITVTVVPLTLNLGPDQDVCATPNVTLNAGNTGATYSWSNGATTQTIQATSAGTYYVDVLLSGCPASDTIKITQNPVPVVDIGNDTTMCGAPNFVLNAGNNGSTYSWSTGATTQQITVTIGGNYIVTVNNGTCTQKDTIIVIEKPVPNVNLGSDTIMCDNPSTLLLNAGAGTGNVYTWNTGATTQGITVSSSGVYHVTVNKNGCTDSDTVNISYLEVPSVSDTIICSNSSITLNANAPTGVSYLWSTGATTNTITVSDSGLYYIEIVKGSCFLADTFRVQVLPSLGDLVVPNVFTPNGDAFNNYFDITSGGLYNIGTFDLKVYDRWGVLMYETSDVKSPWDGKHKNKDAPAGVYYYIITAEDACKQETVTKNGFVQIIR